MKVTAGAKVAASSATTHAYRLHVWRHRLKALAACATGVANPEVARDPAPSVALWTESDESTLELWPHKFEAMYTVRPLASFFIAKDVDCQPEAPCLWPLSPAPKLLAHRHSCSVQALP